MDALVQFLRRCALPDKLLHLHLQLRISTSHVMKDETKVASEHQFIINVVVTTLVGIKRLSRMLL